MDNKPQSHVLLIKRNRELLIWVFIVVGLLLLTASFVPSFPPELQTILRSLGLSLAPAGVVTIVLSRYASSITEALLRETVEATIRERLQQDMKQLNSTVGVGMEKVATKVNDGVTQIERDMQRLSPLFFAAGKLGLENVHLNRNLALDQFAWFLDAEIQKSQRNEPARVWIVSSSIKGFLEATSEHFDGRKMMAQLTQGKCDIRIMMTDPKVADLRAKQERRKDGEIPMEVQMNLAYLKRIGVRRESVRFYSGTPTVFAVATTDRMLLNPYPYQREAFRCFSMIVQQTNNPEADIYTQYLRYHFEEPWQRTMEILADEWEKL
jgi:hypothetical protein